MYVVRSGGGTALRLTRDAKGFTPAWSPHRRRIVFARGVGALDLYTMDRGGRDVRRVTSERRTPTAWSSNYAPAWSKGSYLVFARMRVKGKATSYSVATVALDGSNLRVFARDAAPNAEPALSPDASFVAYVDRENRLLRVTVQGTERRILARDAFSPSYSPDGTKIAFSRGAGGIWVLGAEGGNARRVLPWGADPSWSPDGDQLAFSAPSRSGKGGAAIWIVDASGRNPRQLTAPPGLRNDLAPAWR